MVGLINFSPTVAILGVVRRALLECFIDDTEGHGQRPMFIIIVVKSAGMHPGQDI